PLTGLPGRTVIDAEIKKRLANEEKSFALMCIDINGLKVFNDSYGFLQGDKIIILVAEILAKCVETGFIGHNGGDDFVVLLTPETIDAVCQKIILMFDEKIQGLYLLVDKEKHKEEKIGLKVNPALTISIGVTINNEKQSFKRPLDIFDAAAEMMEHAKSLHGSGYYKKAEGEKAEG
ncbi:GGDEF domain-containing protein, partial [Candidatus Desantisbacteria bacterium]|nr:GGDEF domain-containing protein [Candidatus Desantisbacteria bacterium]